MKVAIVSTHPIQYHTPWYRELARQPHIDLNVYYALMPDQHQQGVGFGEAFAWDIPLLEGYDWEAIPNKRKSPSLRGFFRSSTPGVYSLLARTKPDAVIITGWQSLPLLQALWACIRLGIPRIVRGESNSARPRPLLVRTLHRLLLSRFDAFLAIGKLNRQFYLDYGIPDERVFSTPYFVDNQRFADQFRKDVGERVALRAGWKIEERRSETGDGAPGTADGRPQTADGRRSPVIDRTPSPVDGPRSPLSRPICFLFAGKLEPKKRLMDLLQAIERACGDERGRTTDDGVRPTTDDGRPSPGPALRSPMIHLLVAGTGELMEGAREFSETRRLPVTFAGFLNQTEITRAYAAADCLVLPSDYGETWGLVVNEAMACGLPAIVSDRVGCGPDLVEEGITGSVFPFGDIDALARMLVDFASDPEKLMRMGAQARQRIESYSVERAVQGTIRAIEFASGEDGRRKTDDGLRSPVSGLRVLHVIPSLSPKDGGPSFALPLIARGLERAGIAVDIATTSGADEAAFPSGDLANPVTTDGVNYFCFRRQSGFYKVSLPLSRWLASKIRNYDLVHIHALFSYSSYTAAKVARKNAVPYIVRPLGVLNRWGMQNRRRLLKRLSFRFVEQPIIRNAAAIHYTSQQEKLEAEEAGVRNESVVIPLAVDLSAVSELPGPERFYERFAEATGREIILYLSRLDPKKGLDLLLQAFAEMDGGREKGGWVTVRGLRSSVSGRPRSPVSGRPLLVIAGEGDDQFVAGLRRLAVELGIDDQVLWAGFLGGSDKLSALAAASVFVLPSYSENFGLALVEAMAAGLPCVMSDHVGIAVDAEECDAGLVVPCEVGALASAMRRLLNDSDLRGRLGSNARRLVEERFSVEAMSNSLVKLYERVLRQMTDDRRPRTETDDRRPTTADRRPVNSL